MQSGAGEDARPDSRPFDSAQGRLAGATARGLRSWRDYGNFVHSTASEINLPIFGRGHIPYDTATGRNSGFREALRLRIEAHQSIRVHAGFAIPNHAIRRCGDAIRLRT